MDESTTPLGRRVERLVDLSGKGRAELSELAGLAQSHVGAIIRGSVKSPAAATTVAIARVTGCTLHWLLTGEGPEPTADSVRAAVERARRAQDPNAVADDAPLAAVG